MIKKLRIKIIVVLTILLTLIVVGIMGAINIISQTNNKSQINERLVKIAYNDGVLPKEYNDIRADGQSGYMDNFSILINGANVLLGIQTSRNFEMSQDEYIAYAVEALNSGQKTGEIENYAYMTELKYYGKIIVFLDISQYQQANQHLLITTMIIGVTAVLIFFAFSVGLSFWLVKPVKETFEKQKLFISNASHELKTPLAVISANTDVLEAEIGENKWLSYIRSESQRMSELVNELLSLARLEDKSGHKLIMSELNLTDLVFQTALPFESTIFEMGKKFEVEAEPDIKYRGDESSLKHVLTILIDNAVKYSNESGSISVKLYTRSNKKVIEVYNTGEGIRQENLSKVFERFFRQDESRNSKSGGYGLGLAIAKASVEAHNGKIYAQSEYGKWVKFTVVL